MTSPQTPSRTRILLAGLLMLAFFLASTYWLHGYLNPPNPLDSAASDQQREHENASPDASAADALGAAGLLQEAPDPDDLVQATGRVLNGETDEGVPEAEVFVRHPGGTTSRQTDEDGYFLVPDLWPGPLTLSAQRDHWSGGGPAAKPLELKAAPGDDLNELSLTLFEDGSLTGRVILDDRPGPANLTVHYIFDASGSMDHTLEPVPSDPEGRFTLQNLPPGQVRVEASDGRFVLANPPEVLITGGSSTDLGDLRLVFGAALQGFVKDAQSGRALPQASVTLIDGNKTRFRRFSARTDPKGRFTLAGVPGEWGTLEVSAAGYAQAQQEIQFNPGTRMELAPILLVPRKGLVVRVVDQQQQPVSGAQVLILDDPQGQPLFTETSGGGDVLIEALEGGPYLVRAVHDVQGASKDVLASAGETVTVMLGPASAVVGHVRGSDGSTPATFAVALISTAPDTAGQTAARQQFDGSAGGYFSFAAVAPGGYVVEAAADGFAVARSQPIVVVTGQESRVSLTLPAGGQIGGFVRDASTGTPIAGANVQVGYTREATGGPLFTTTDTEGRFLVQGVDPERKTVEVSANGYVTRLVSGLKASAGRTLTLDIELIPLPPGVSSGTQLVGIGATLGRDGDAVIIREALFGSPAHSMGLSKGDKILAIDGEPVTGMDLTAIVERIRGDEGSNVRLTIQRGDQPPQDHNLTRKPVTQQQ